MGRVRRLTFLLRVRGEIILFRTGQDRSGMTFNGVRQVLISAVACVTGDVDWRQAMFTLS